MTRPDPAPVIDELLAHADWLRRLAARLATVDASADDLAQRTWARALNRPPSATGGSLRAWLARVLRNEARTVARTERRRRDHERLSSADAPRTARAADAAVGEREQSFLLQKRLVAAVDSLDEPQRTAILLRYFSGLGPSEIADRTGESVRTIESRLRRGREQLRARLDSDHGSRAAWSAIALPAVHSLPKTAAAAAASSATIAMGTKALLVGASALVLLGLGVRVGLSSSADDDATDTVSVERDAELDRAADEVADVRANSGVRRATEESASEAATVAPAAEPAEATTLLTGRVLDEEGEPVPFCRVRLDPPAQRDGESLDAVETDASGTFEIPVLRSAPVLSKLAPADPALTSLYARGVRSSSFLPGYGPVLIVAPARTVGVRVVTPDGDPVAGAELTLSPPDGLRTRFDDLLFDESQIEWTGTTNELGVHVFDGVPALARSPLVASAEGFVDASLEVGEAGTVQDFVVTLEPVDPGRAVAGVVLDANGDPVEDAVVGLGQVAKWTEADGRFEFQLDREAGLLLGPQRILAAAAGWCPTTFEPDADDDTPAESIEWPAWVELRLTRGSLSISGTVLDGRGEPLPDAIVWIEDVTVIGCGSYDEPRPAEHLGGETGYLWQKHTTDSNGRFVVPQLSDRTYRLAAMNPETLHVCDGVEIAAGTTDARLQLDPSVEFVEMRGKLVDQTGAPVAGATLSLWRTSLVVPQPGTSSARIEHARTENRTSAADGSFDLGTVPLHGGTHVSVYGKGFSAIDAAVNQLDRPHDELELTLYRSCEARIVDESPESSRATSFCLRDGHGEKLNVTFFRGTSGTMSTAHPTLTDGASGTFRVSGEAQVLELYRKGEVVMTRPVKLDPSEVNELKR